MIVKIIKLKIKITPDASFGSVTQTKINIMKKNK